MGLICQFIGAVILDAAMLMLVIYLALHTSEKNSRVCGFAVTMGIGFLVGSTGQCFGGSCAVLLVYALGFMLSYTAFLFTLSK